MVYSNLAALKAVKPLKREFSKSSFSNPGSDGFVESWRVNGLPILGVLPPLFNAGAGYTCDKSTQGAMNIIDAAGGKSIYLHKFKMTQVMPASNNIIPGLQILLYDRQWACCGFNGADLTLQSVTTPGALPARPDTTGEGVELWFINYGGIGSGAPNVTFNYLNQDGVSKSTTVQVDASLIAADTMKPIPLAAGDTGIRRLDSIQNASSFGSAVGQFGVMLMRRVLETNIMPGGQTVDGLSYNDALAIGFQKVDDGSCLELLLHRNSTSGVFTTAMGELHFTLQ